MWREIRNNHQHYMFWSYIFNVKTPPKIPFLAKNWFEQLLLSLLQKLNLLLKHVGRKRLCCSTTSSTWQFRSHCSQDQEAPESSKAIAFQFARRYLSAASAYFFDYRVLVMPWISLIGGLIILISGLINLIGGLISLIGGLISIFGGLISVLSGLISPNVGLISLICGIISLISVLINQIFGLISLIGGLISLISGLINLIVV